MMIIVCKRDNFAMTISANRFWLDQGYAPYIESSAGKIPLKLKTLYREPVIFYLFMAGFGLLVSLSGASVISAFIDINMRITYQEVATIATVVQCVYTPPQGKANAGMDFTLSYPLQDSSGTITQGTSEV